MSDKPDMHIIKTPKLDLEGTLKPVGLSSPDGKVLVKFPNFYNSPAEEAEEFMAELDNAMSTGRVTPVMRKWLPVKEYEKLKKGWPTYAAMMSAAGEVFEAMGEMFGTLGEGNASENS